MSVAEIGALHGRYVRLTDRFKSAWTYHQFAAGVFKNFLGEPLPYTIDFQKIYDHIKGISGSLTATQALEATSALAANEIALDRATKALLKADERVPPSMLRRFFEKLKRQDDTIIHHLIKFFLYSDAVEGDRRDKLDFLFTRLGEDFMTDRGEYWSRDSLEFRERISALVSVLRVAESPQEEIVQIIRAIRTIRDEIQQAEHFEDLTDRNLLQNARTFKHRVGDLYFHPDVLLAIVDLNVSTKNRFIRLYRSDEHKIVEDAEKLMLQANAIERNFGDSNPQLVEEMARFREFKERFDHAREQSNIKHDVITHLKSSVTNILAQLDRGLEFEEKDVPLRLPETVIDDKRQIESLAERFGRDDVLLEYLRRIAVAIQNTQATLPPENLVDLPPLRDLRLEPWEVAAYEKLLGRRPAESDEDNDDLWILYLRAAALRIKVDEEATLLATTRAANIRPEADLLRRPKLSLDLAKSLDELFGVFLHEAVYYSNTKILHQLYRSRFRLLRAFSGLWLIYDRLN